MGVHEPIVNLEMSGFLYASMINLTPTESHGQWEIVGTLLRPVGIFSKITCFKD